MEEIGRQIKAALPNNKIYANMPDAMLGELYMRKYRKKESTAAPANPYLYLGNQQVLGQQQQQKVPDLSQFERKQEQPKVNLSNVIKTAAPSGTMNSLPQQTNDSPWALQPVVDWFKGFQAPKTEFMDIKNMGF